MENEPQRTAVTLRPDLVARAEMVKNLLVEHYAQTGEAFSLDTVIDNAVESFLDAVVAALDDELPGN